MSVQASVTGPRGIAFLAVAAGTVCGLLKIALPPPGGKHSHVSATST